MKTQKSLGRIQAELSAIYAYAPVAMVLLDRELKVCSVNQFAADLADRSPKEMIGFHVGEALHCRHHLDDPRACGFGPACDTCPVRKAVLDTFKDQKSRKGVEAWYPIMRGKAVEPRCLLIATAHLEVDEEGSVLVFFQDITPYKKTEQELRESEERYQLLSDATFEAIFLSEEGICIGQNKTAERMFGYSLAEARGQACTQWVVPEDRETLMRNISSEYEYPYEVTALRKDGSTFPCEIQARMMDYKGKRIRITALRDVTQRKEAEMRLRDSEARLRTLINTTPDVIFFKDGKGRWLEANDAALELFSLTDVDYRGRTDSELAAFTDPVCRPAFLTCAATDEKAWQAKGLSRGEEVVVKPDGTRKIYDVIKMPLFEHDGSRKGLIVLGRDITERKAAEQALRESEENYRRIFENSVVGFYQSTSEGRFIRVNAAFAKMLGYDSPEELVSSIADIATQYYVHPEDRTRFQRLLAAHGSVENFEFLARRKDGSTLWVSNSTRAYFDADGMAIRYEGMVIDITERKQIQETLQSERRQLLSIFDSIDEIIYVCDPYTHEILYTNKKLKDAFGKDPVGGICYREFQGLDAPCEFCTNDIILKQKYAPYRWEYYNPKLDRHYDIIDRIIQWPDGRDVRFEMAMDITERKRAEEEREGLQDQLVHAQKMESVGRLAGGVAHDFNNMLGVILGRAEMMLATMKPEDPHYVDLEEIYKAAARSTDLTRQLLAFARKQSISPKVLDLNKTVAETLKMLRRLIGENIQLEWKQDTSLWPVKMDPAQVDQILANLCVNARDAIPGVGKVIISTRNVVLDEAYCAIHAGFVPGRYVMLEVSDNGCGMDSETLDKVFEPFFTTKEVGKGTGLGLSTVYGIVKQNGGFINIYSEPNKGTTVKIYIPRHEGDLSKRIDKKPMEFPRGQGETLLLVEDDPGVLAMGEKMLQRLGYRVLVAGDPHEAVKIVRGYPDKIHLLLTDVVMPQMSGKMLAERVKQINPDVKVMFMSGYTADIIVHESVLDKGVRFIQKPFMLQTLAAKVREALDHEEREE